MRVNSFENQHVTYEATIDRFSPDLDDAVIRKATLMRAEAKEAMRDSYHMRQHLTPLLDRLAEDEPEFMRRYWRSMLTAMVDTAMQISGADMGNIQLFDPASAALHLEAERGFSRAFLTFFNSVQGDHTACSAAFQRRKQVVVEDVTESAIFFGTPGLEVMLDAGARSVQSTPMVGHAGTVLGIMSTHWHKPCRVSGETLLRLNLLSRSVAEWLEARMHLAPVNGNRRDSCPLGGYKPAIHDR